MEIKIYPDGTSYVIGYEQDLEELGCITHQFKINSYEDLWHLNQWVDAYNTCNFGVLPSITIPNLIDAQADRRFHENHSSGLKLICKFLNTIPANFKIFHPHNPEVVEALMDNVEIIDNSEFIETVIHRLDDTEKNSTNIFKQFGKSEIGTKVISNLILMSSDAGGFKPLIKLCDKLGWKGETYSSSKARSWSEEDGTKFTQQIDRQDFGGKDILIVDDISVYGGTFKGLSKLLRERNCGKLYLAVSHMTIQNLGGDPVTNYFDKVFTTNSKYDTYYSNYCKCDKDGKPENLEIIKLF